MTGKSIGRTTLHLMVTLLLISLLPACAPSGPSTDTGKTGTQEKDLSVYEGDNVFDFVDGSDPLMPVWSITAGGYKPQSDDPREQVVIDEHFTVAAGEVKTFQNQIVRIIPTGRGDIEVYGTLIIRDSLLLWEQTEHQQTRLRIKDGGTLIIENSYAFQANEFWLNWDYESGSTVRLNHFVGQPWTSIQGAVSYTSENYSTVKLTLLSEVHDSVIDISDAHHVWLEIFPAEGTYEATLPDKLQWIDWQLSDMWPNTSVSIRRSYLYERDISLNNNTHVTVLNTPSGFSLGWAISSDGPDFVDCELRGLGKPGDEGGVLYEDTTWDLPCNNSSLTVKNSLLQRAWPVSSGYVHLKIYDSFLVDPRNYVGPGTMEIYDSTIDHIAAYRGGRVYIENSQIRYDIEVKDPGSGIYGYGVTKRGLFGDVNVIEVDGGTYTELDAPGPPW